MPGLAVVHWIGVCVRGIFKAAKVFRSADPAAPFDVHHHVRVGVVREVPEASEVGAEAGCLLVARGSAAVGVNWCRGQFRRPLLLCHLRRPPIRSLE